MSNSNSKTVATTTEKKAVKAQNAKAVKAQSAPKGVTLAECPNRHLVIKLNTETAENNFSDFDKLLRLSLEVAKASRWFSKPINKQLRREFNAKMTLDEFATSLTLKPTTFKLMIRVSTYSQEVVSAYKASTVEGGGILEANRSLYGLERFYKTANSGDDDDDKVSTVFSLNRTKTEALKGGTFKLLSDGSVKTSFEKEELIDLLNKALEVAQAL